MIAVPEWVDADRARACGLNSRHVDVLTGIASGLTNASIGARHGLAEDTVKKYLKQLYRHLKACDRASAVAISYDSGLLRTAVEREWRAQMGLVAA